MTNVMHRLPLLFVMAWIALGLVAVSSVLGAPAPAVPHRALSADCPLGLLSLRYTGRAEVTGNAADLAEVQAAVPDTALLLQSEVQEGFAPTDTTSGAAFSISPPFLGPAEGAAAFLLEWEGSAAAPPSADCLPVLGDEAQVQWLLTVDVEDSTILSAVDISVQQSEDPIVSDPQVLPALSFPPATTAALLTPVGRAANQFNLSFTCAQAGNVGVLLRLTLLAPDASGALVQSTSHTVKFSKQCAPITCDDLCVHGVCDPDTARCVCDEGYNLDPYCTYGVYANTTSVCADEDFTFTWDVTLARQDDYYALTDWLAVLGPDASCPSCPWSIERTLDNYMHGYLVTWFYFMSLTVTWYDGDPALQGQLTMRMRDELPGTWAYAYFVADSTDKILAIVSVEQLPRDHPRCIARANAQREAFAAQTLQLQNDILTRATPTALVPFWPPLDDSPAAEAAVLSTAPMSIAEALDAVQCVSGSLGADGTCECPEGRWGPLCEQGCDGVSAPLLMDGWFGGELGNSAAGLPLEYINFAVCSWLIRIPQPATGMRLRFSSLLTEVADFVTVTAGTLQPDAADPLDTSSFLPVAKLSGSYPNGMSDFVVSNATSVLVHFEADLSHATESWFNYYGMRMSFIGTGCPAGYVVSRGVSLMDAVPLALVNVARCEPCPAGSFSATADADRCEPCAPGSFAAAPGTSQCTPVARGFFQTAAGATGSLSCADAGWPSACPVPPYPVGGAQSGLLFFCALLLAALLVLLALLFIYRRQRVLFHASPQFLGAVLVGLLLFTVGLLLHAQEPTAGLCRGKPFLLFSGPTLLLSALLVRSYRLHRIFHNSKLSVARLPLWKLWATVTALLVVDLALLAALDAKAPLTVSDAYFPECQSDDSDLARALLATLLCYQAALAALLAAVALKLRAIPPAYNETKEMLAAMGNLALLLLIGAVYAYSPLGADGSTGSATQLQIALGLYGVASTAAILFGAKFAALYAALIQGRNKLKGESGDVMTTQVKSAGGVSSAEGHTKVLSGYGSAATAGPPTRSQVHPWSPPSAVRAAAAAGLLPLAPSHTGKPSLSVRVSTAAAAAGSENAHYVTGVATVNVEMATAPNSVMAAWGAAPGVVSPNTTAVLASPSAVANSLTAPGARLQSVGGASSSPIAAYEVTQAGDASAPSALLVTAAAAAGDRTSAAIPGGLTVAAAAAAADGASSSAPQSMLPGAAADQPRVSRARASTAVSASAAVTKIDVPGPASLRARWQAARAEVSSLQATVTRMRAELERQERRLQQANNKCMTLAFEIEAGGEQDDTR